MALRPREFLKPVHPLRNALVSYIDGELMLLSVSFQEVGIPRTVQIGLPLALPDDVARELERMYRWHDWLVAEYSAIDTGKGGATPEFRYEFLLITPDPERPMGDQIRDALWRKVYFTVERGQTPGDEFSVTVPHELNEHELAKLRDELLHRMNGFAGDGWDKVKMEVVENITVVYTVSRPAKVE